MKELIKKLSDMRGVSGFEYGFSDEVSKLFEPYADKVYTDALGNVIAEKKCGKENALKIMIEGHMDEIGLMVSGIDENGFLSFVPVGGIDERILPSAEVTVHGKHDIRGVIGAKPPHLQSADESKSAMKIEDMSIDTGYSYDEVIKIVSVGAPVTMRQSVGEMKGGSISFKALDDRAGVAAVIDAFERLSKYSLSADVYAVATVQEEVGLRGAKTAAHIVNPDISISVDVCHGITPDNSENAFECGSGCIISLGPNIHPKIGKRLIKLADRYNIPFDIDVDGGYTGTNAWAVQTARCGIATALLSIPLKYMHNPVETAKLSDIRATSDLIVRFIENSDEFAKEDLCF